MTLMKVMIITVFKGSCRIIEINGVYIFAQKNILLISIVIIEVGNGS